MIQWCASEGCSKVTEAAVAAADPAHMAANEGCSLRVKMVQLVVVIVVDVVAMAAPVALAVEVMVAVAAVLV